MFYKYFKLLFLIIVLLSNFKLTDKQPLAKSINNDAQEIIDNAESKPGQIKDVTHIIDGIEQNKQSPSISRNLINSILNSKEEKTLIETNQAQSPSTNELINLDTFTTDLKKIKSSSSKDNTPNLLIFASFSLPSQSFKQLAEQSRKAGGVIVFRGVCKGSLKKTISLIYELDKAGISVIIHPKLFKEFNVKSVPTFILKEDSNSCLQDNCTLIIDKITGNVPLRYALETFAREGNYKELADTYLKNLNGSIS